MNLTLSTKMKENFILSLSALFLIVSCGDNNEEFDSQNTPNSFEFEITVLGA